MGVEESCLVEAAFELVHEGGGGFQPAPDREKGTPGRRKSLSKYECEKRRSGLEGVGCPTRLGSGKLMGVGAEECVKVIGADHKGPWMTH